MIEVFPTSKKRNGKDPSIWVLMARQPKDFGILWRTWTQIKVLVMKTSLWSDDHANVLGAFRKSEKDQRLLQK